MARSLKYGEPTVKKEVRLPESLNEALVSQAKKSKRNMSDIVVEALNEKLIDKEEGMTVSASKLHSINEATIEKAVLSAFKKQGSQQPEGHIISLAPELEEKLEQVSKSIGFSEPADLVEEVLRVMLRDPSQLRELVIGKTIRDLEAVIGSLSEVETPKRSRKVA